MDDHKIKHADVTSAGLILTFADGREGLITGGDLLECVERTDGFEKVKELQAEDQAEALDEPEK